MRHALALSLLLFSLGARPAESALITIDHTTPFTRPGQGGLPADWVFPSWVNDGVFGGLLSVWAFGGLGYFDRSPVATVWSLDVIGVRLFPLLGATIVSMDVSGGSHGNAVGFWVDSTHYAPGRYTVAGGHRVAWTAPTDHVWPWPPGTLGRSQPLTIYSVTLDVPDAQGAVVPEPAVGFLLLGGMWALLARSLRRTRG